MKLTFSAFNRILQVRYFKAPSLEIKGYTSRTKDGLHVLYLDYDMVSPEIVEQDIRHNLKGQISHAFIFTTYEGEDESGLIGNYHVISLDKFHFNDAMKNMAKTHSDSYHRELAKITRFRSWVLRFTGKGKRSEPKFVKYIPLEDTGRMKSNAHRLLLEILHPNLKPLMKNPDWQFDDYTETKITEYKTIVERKTVPND